MSQRSGAPWRVNCARLGRGGASTAGSEGCEDGGLGRRMGEGASEGGLGASSSRFRRSSSRNAAPVSSMWEKQIPGIVTAIAASGAFAAVLLRALHGAERGREIL
jgi:hypothetical protein